MQTDEKKADNTWIFSLVLVGCIVFGVLIAVLKLTGLF